LIRSVGTGGASWAACIGVLLGRYTGCTLERPGRLGWANSKVKLGWARSVAA
jgi:hypothetical protein